MIAALVWIRAHWKPCLAALLLALAYTAGFFTGRKGPAPDRITEKTHQQTATQVVKSDDTKTSAKIAIAQKQTKRRQVKAVTHTDRKPNGEVITDRTVTVADASDSSNTTDGSAASDDRSKEHDASRVTLETSKVTDFRRSWMAGALIGAQLRNPISNAGNPLGAPAFGLQLAHRTDFIPLPGLDRGWIGLWAIGTPGSLGSHPVIMGGLSLGVEF